MPGLGARFLFCSVSMGIPLRLVCVCHYTAVPSNFQNTGRVRANTTGKKGEYIDCRLFAMCSYKF